MPPRDGLGRPRHHSRRTATGSSAQAAAPACTPSSTAGWTRCASVELYAYRLPADAFAEHDAAVVATDRGTPLGPPERVGDLFELHEEAGIQLRVLPRLHEFWAEVITSTLEWSGIRLRNARP